MGEPIKYKNKPGYIKRYRLLNALWLLVWVIIGVSVVSLGYVIWHTRANILTVLGVLLVLPGAKRIVALVVCGKKRSVSPERIQKIEEAFPDFSYATDIETFNHDPYGDEEGEDAGEDFSIELTGTIIFTDYIFTSPEKIMMCDFLIESEGNIYILPTAKSDDFEYIKNYLTDGIKKICPDYHILFVGSDDDLFSKKKKVSAVKIPLDLRLEVLNHLKSLAV